MGQLTALLVCLGVSVLAKADAPQGNVDRGGKPRAVTQNDYGNLFGGGGNSTQGNKGQGQGQGQSTAQLNQLLATGRLMDVFVNGTDNVTTQFSPLLSAQTVSNLLELRNLECPNGVKVFNVSSLMLREALHIAAALKILLPAKVNSTNFFYLNASRGSVRFTPLICWNDTKQKLNASLADFPDGLIKQALIPKLLARITNEAARNMATILPERALRLLCEKLVEADFMDMLAITEVFNCNDFLKMEASNNSRLASALLQGNKARGLARLTDSEWDAMMRDYGRAMPRDFLQMAPPQKVKERFADIWDQDKADAIVGRVNFSTVNESFVTALGPQIACQLPTSALLRIPTGKLQQVKGSLSCLKNETNNAKKRALADKMLGARNTTVCRPYLTIVDATDDQCWKVMSPQDLQAVNVFTNFSSSDLAQLSCDTIASLKSKLQLGKVSNWTQENLQTFSWMLRCLGVADSDDIRKVTDAIVGGTVPAANLILPPTVARRVFNAVKGRLLNNQQIKLNVSVLTTLGSTVEAMTGSEVNSLLTADLVDEVLPKMQGAFSMMGKAARRALLNKLTPGQLKKRLCEMNSSLAEDLDGQQLANMTGLYDQLFVADASKCKFQCHGPEQCSAVFDNMASSLVNNSVWNMSVPFLEWARGSGVICGMTLDKVITLQPDSSLLDIASTYWTAGCKTPKTARTLYNKVKLFLELYDGDSLSETQVELFGGNFAKHVSSDDLNGYSNETRRSILRSMGKADLEDVSSKWVKDMAATAVAELVKGAGVIDDAAILGLGLLVCGLNASHMQSLTADALTDALPKLSQCPDISVGVLDAAWQTYIKKRNLNYSNMDAADMSLGGIALLSDCQNIDKIPDAVKSQAVGDMAEAFGNWKSHLKTRRQQWQDQAASDKQTQNATQNALQCSLTKLLEARARSRTSTQSRRKRSTGSITCDDIRQLGESVSILTPENINTISITDFNSCIDLMANVEDWTQEQKKAVALKAKEAWGPVSTWSSDTLLMAGTVLQGLTTVELSGLNVTLQHVEQWGQFRGWSEEQLRAVFTISLSSTGQGVAGLTSSQITQLGYFMCGLAADQITQINKDAFLNAMSDLGNAVSQCSLGSLQAWATVAVQALGPVSGWTIAQTAAVERMLAGLGGSDLSQLSASQLSVINLDTLALIAPATFVSLTVSQLESLSLPQAMSITNSQLERLDKQQQDSFALYGITISAKTSSPANGLATMVGSVGFVAMAVLITILG